MQLLIDYENLMKENLWKTLIFNMVWKEDAKIVVYFWIKDWLNNITQLSQSRLRKQIPIKFNNLLEIHLLEIIY